MEQVECKDDEKDGMSVVVVIVENDDVASQEEEDEDEFGPFSPELQVGGTN